MLTIGSPRAHMLTSRTRLPRMRLALKMWVNRCLYARAGGWGASPLAVAATGFPELVQTGRIPPLILTQILTIEPFGQDKKISCSRCILVMASLGGRSQEGGSE